MQILCTLFRRDNLLQTSRGITVSRNNYDWNCFLPKVYTDTVHKVFTGVKLDGNSLWRMNFSPKCLLYFKKGKHLGFVQNHIMGIKLNGHYYFLDTGWYPLKVILIETHTKRVHGSLAEIKTKVTLLGFIVKKQNDNVRV